MLPAEICALWRQLGIDVTPEMERAVRDSYRDSISRQRQHALWRALVDGHALSPDAEDLLSSITVPWDGHSHHPLWQVQEAVARTSGVNVISDCFVQPPRDPTRRLSILDSSYAAKRALGLWRFRDWRERHESELHQLTASGAYDEAYRELVSIPTTITALNWLMILCHPQEARTDLLSSASAAYRRDCSGSEWGDAGSFLRFRSLNRDVWRASMLPPHALKAFDEKLGRFTENVGGTTQPLPSASISFLPEDAAWLIAQLDDLQLLHGGTLAYEDVSTPGGRQRQYLRRELLERVVQGRAVLRLLAALDDAQWDQLRTQGLRLPADLTPEQRAMPALREKIDAMGMTRAREAGELALEYVPAGSGWHVNPELTGIRIRRRDEDMGTWDVSCSLSRQPDNLTPLRVTEEVAPSSFQPSSLERSAN